MDTVSMLNKMSFYCQPILPLVYDESMSYYETLCKVVGQLNTTGDAVNKLNEGLTGEIADRQAADAALDERLKAIETEKAKTHFLVFDGANPNGGFPTRHELYQWVEAGDAIFTLFRTNEEGRGQIYAASCSYNAGNWGSEASNDFSIIVPIETSYDTTRDYAVKQKVAKLSIPLSPQTNLNVAWRLQIIEINTPSTSAEGVVNLVAVINDSDSVNCSITPSEFLGLYNMTRGGKNLCVAVNAKLSYDGLARSSSVATVDTTNRKIRIAFERDYGTFIENGVKQLNKTLDYIIGDVSTNVWTHETIDSKTLDFTRYEGFQFTRGADNVITANDESTPNAVYAQYHSDTSGKLYQNLPVRLIDTVDNAEYWNGVFDIKDGKHMTFTFVTSNYVTASGKMLVRVIELSADVNTTTWNYAEKEFELPLNVSNVVVTYTASKIGEGEYKAAAHKTEYQVDFVEGIPAIIASIEAGKRVILKINLKDPDSSESYPIYFSSGYTRVDPFTNSAHYIFTGTLGDDQFTLELNSLLTHATFTTYGYILPEPNPDGSDSGKVPTVNGTKWGLKTLPPAATVDTAMSDTSTNAVQNKVIKKYVDDSVAGGGSSNNAVLYTAQTLTEAQKKQARDNIDAEIADFVIHATPINSTNYTLDKTFAQIQEAVQAGKKVYAKLKSRLTVRMPLVVSNANNLIFGATISTPDNSEIYALVVTASEAKFVGGSVLTYNSDGDIPQVYMSSDPTEAMQIATKKYVDDHLSGAPITIKLGTGNAATSTATFAEIKAALEAGKAPILDSAPGTSHWFALNWTLSGTDRLTIQYGTFNVDGGGLANFTFDNVAVSSTGITYASSQFTTE